MNEKYSDKIKCIINIFYFAAIIITFYLIWRFLGIIFPFVLALILVTLTRPLVNFLHKRINLNNKFLSVIIVVLFYLLAGSIIAWIIVRVVMLLSNIIPGIPGFYQKNIAPLLEESGAWIESLFSDNPDIGSNIHLFSSSLTEGLQNFVSAASQKGANWLTGFLKGIPGFFVNVIVTIMLSVFISMQYDSILAFLKAQLPKKLTGKLSGIQGIIQTTVFKYLKCVFILMAITFSALCIGLLILNVPNAVITAAGIAILDALPVLGTGTVLLPWAAIELLKGNVFMALGLFVLYLLTAVGRNILEPKIIGAQMGLNPVAALLCMYAGFKLFGIPGMILAPMLIHILLVLHKEGRIKLFNRYG